MTASAQIDRRSFLRGRMRPQAEPLRPPWSTARSVLDYCQACGKCADACPERIISPGRNGHPVVSFAAGECTFCAACADACPAPVFADRAEPPWTLTLTLADGCLAAEGITCRSCGDACPERAIHFTPRIGGTAVLHIDHGACTGCGACIPVCPRGVLSLAPQEPTR